MTEQTDTLLALAEVAVALAGFSAIVVVLKRGVTGQWTSHDADRFHGMIIHAIAAVVFCLLPMIVDVVVQDVVTTMHICCRRCDVRGRSRSTPFRHRRNRGKGRPEGRGCPRLRRILV